MKKNKLYTVNKRNRPAFMPYGENPNYYDLGSWLNNIFDKTTDKLRGVFGGDKLSPTAGSFIGAAGTAIGGAANKILSGGLNSGAGNAVANIGGMAGGLISKVNPLLGGIVSAGTGLLGGLANAAFGSKMKEDNIADVEGNIANMRATRINGATSNTDLLNKWNTVDLGYNFNKSYIGRDGWFSNKAGKKFRTLQNQQNAAREYVKHQLFTAANQADRTQDDLAQSTFIYSDGGGIHIDPSKKGTFTAAASKHGMGVQEFASKVLANKEDYSPTMVKKANFARNSKSWKHKDGGYLVGKVYDLPREAILDLLNQGYEIEYV